MRRLRPLRFGNKANGGTAAAVKQTRGTTKRDTRPRKAGPSRASKRKAAVKTPVIDSESELDKPSRMDVDDDDAEAKLEGEEEIAEPATPERSDLDTTEDEDDDDLDAIPASRPAKTDLGSKGKAIETATQSQSSQRQKNPEAPPPRRELPFTRGQEKQPVKKVPARPVQDDDETTTTDDDEL